MVYQEYNQHRTNHGVFDAHGFEKHIVLTRGVLKGEKNVLCRISSECCPGTQLLSAECDCKEQIQYSLGKISEVDRGIFIYLLGHEGRGHGIAHKIMALANKNRGFDTFTAIEELGTPVDIRDFSVVKDILQHFEITSICCLTNSPDKLESLKTLGINIASTQNIPVTPNVVSKRHLLAKQSRGHNIVFKDEVGNPTV
ncbi:MAG: GTP cyclohydrolase II [Firmicutes bacterium]|nr:GTP cyclohydrolase II [Bacillota bacterium]